MKKSRAQLLVESATQEPIDEALASAKKRIREALGDENGSRGIRALTEVAQERIDMMRDQENEEAPNPKTDKDMELLNETMPLMKEGGKKLRAVKENVLLQKTIKKK